MNMTTGLLVSGGTQAAESGACQAVSGGALLCAARNVRRAAAEWWRVTVVQTPLAPALEEVLEAAEERLGLWLREVERLQGLVDAGRAELAPRLELRQRYVARLAQDLTGRGVL